jgi:surface polysaccharide O-acyltransferase-like enzyme
MERNYAIDYLKFYAIFAVILIHTGPFEGAAIFGIDGYYIDFTIDTLSRFAVPFFFISSGYLFGMKMQTTKSRSIYFSSYVSKMVNLFLSWFIFYLLYDLFVKIFFGSFNPFSVPEIIKFIEENIKLEVFFYGASTGYQLWYLIALIWSILILFVFVHLNKLNLLLFISLGLNMIGLFSQSYSGLITLPFGTRDAFFFGLLYTTLGAYAAYNEKAIKGLALRIKPKRLIALFSIFSFLLIIERAVTVFLLDGKIGDYFLMTLPITISLFLYALSKPALGKDSLFTKVGKESVGVYVIHVFFIKFIHLLTDVAGFSSLEENILWHILFSPIVFVLSYLSYGVLQKMKKRKFNLLFKRMHAVVWKQ